MFYANFSLRSANGWGNYGDYINRELSCDSRTTAKASDCCKHENRFKS